MKVNIGPYKKNMTRRLTFIYPLSSPVFWQGPNCFGFKFQTCFHHGFTPLQCSISPFLHSFLTKDTVTPPHFSHPNLSAWSTWNALGVFEGKGDSMTLRKIGGLKSFIYQHPPVGMVLLSGCPQLRIHLAARISEGPGVKFSPQKTLRSDLRPWSFSVEWGGKIHQFLWGWAFQDLIR